MHVRFRACQSYWNVREKNEKNLISGDGEESFARDKPQKHSDKSR